MTILIEERIDTPFGAPASSVSAVSWAAIVAGAVVAAATSLVMVILGSGLGLALASPWPGSAPTVGTFTIMAGIWLIVIQWAASGVGGYLTGRLRTRWVGTHTHEVFFRDTAHGFLAWALSTLLVAVMVTSVIAGGGSKEAAPGAANAYAIDSLLRADRIEDAPTSAATRAEVARILTTGMAKGELQDNDRLYLDRLVALHTGLSTTQAEARVDATLTEVRAAADAARKAASATSIFTALSMLIGAFIASIAAALGGQQRDEHL